jgi:hypothetical protein
MSGPKDWRDPHHWTHFAALVLIVLGALCLLAWRLSW